MPKKGRNDKHEIRVAGEQFLTGDSISISVVFGNLHGRNFDRRSNPRVDHGNWLALMEKEFGIDLPLGATIGLFTPEGAAVEQGVIGEGVPTAAPQSLIAD